ncbi:MAG: PilZ domain-containing protein [Myxococcota bacterium]|nr:PilZ domain-containing protein [Myxococcota bacterium]
MDRSIEAGIVEPSGVGRTLLARMLGVRCGRVWTAASADDAWAVIDEDGPPHLLLVDTDASGDGPRSFLRRLEVGQTDVVVMTRDKDPSVAATLVHDGALEVLAKPLSDRDLARVVRRVRQGEFPEVASRVRGRIAAWAQVLDDAGSPVVSWEVHDLSVSGALLRSHAPIPPGTRLALRLIFGTTRAEARAEIVRVQEPDWGVVPGVAVRFVDGEGDVAEVVRAMGGR